jgi:hypothetical protein
MAVCAMTSIAAALSPGTAQCGFTIHRGRTALNYSLAVSRPSPRQVNNLHPDYFGFDTGQCHLKIILQDTAKAPSTFLYNCKQWTAHMILIEALTMPWKNPSSFAEPTPGQL